MQSDRRAFVKATGMAAVIGTTGLAGCGGLTGGGGGSGAESWQYDPSSLAEAGTRIFGSMNYAQMYENRDQFPESTRESLEGTGDSPIDPANVDALTGVGGVQASMQEQSFGFYGSAAITGSFDKQALTSEMTSDGDVQETGEYEGYTLYEASDMGETGMGMNQYDGSGGIGVGDSAVVFGMSVAQNRNLGVTGADTVRASIDASAGNAALLRDNSQYATELSNKIGDATMRLGAEIDPALVDTAEQQAGQAQSQFVSGIRAGGFGAAIQGATTTFTFVVIYESAQRAEDSGIVGFANGMSTQMENQEGINSVSASQDGAAVIVTMEGDTQTILEQGQSQADPTFGVAPRQF